MMNNTFNNATRAPLVSIVTPSYNQAQFLEETILSVLNQDYHNIEYIIIDGGSKDGSIDIIKKYENRLAYWISEPDHGQSHAINKGWRRATGDIVAYLNSDDLYTRHAVSDVIKAMELYPEAGMVYGNALMINEYGKQIREVAGRPFDLARLITSEEWHVPPQPAVFVRRHALESVGLLDENLHMVMDQDLWIRIGLRYPAVYVPNVHLAKMRVHAEAKSTAAITRFPIDRRHMLNKLYGRSDLPQYVQNLRGLAYARVAFDQAKLAAYAGQSRCILSPLLHAMAKSPVYVLSRPLAYFLIARGLTPWPDKPSQAIGTRWLMIDRLVETWRAAH